MILQMHVHILRFAQARDSTNADKKSQQRLAVTVLPAPLREMSPLRASCSHVFFCSTRLEFSFRIRAEQAAMLAKRRQDQPRSPARFNSPCSAETQDEVLNIFVLPRLLKVTHNSTASKEVSRICVVRVFKIPSRCVVASCSVFSFTIALAFGVWPVF